MYHINTFSPHILSTHPLHTPHPFLGAVVGTDPESGRPVTLRSGRFGKYLQIGADNEKNKTTHSVPQWLNLDASFEDILAFARLPKQICLHPSLNVPIVAEVASKELCVGVQGYPLRISLPPGTSLLFRSYTPPFLHSSIPSLLHSSTSPLLCFFSPLLLHSCTLCCYLSRLFYFTVICQLPSPSL